MEVFMEGDEGVFPDFKDVFGGPPRRFSMQEMRVRYSFCEPVQSEDERLLMSWGPLEEKTVFGVEKAVRRRPPSVDFFDDIFRGDESFSTSLERTDHGRDWDGLFGSRREPFCTLFAAQFSQSKTSGTTNGLSSLHTSNGSFSTFSNQAFQGYDEIKNDVLPVYRQSSFSHEAFLTCENLPNTITSDHKDDIQILKNDTESNGNDQFHFSIYKWAGKGVVPMIMPLLGRNSSRRVSSNGTVESRLSTTKNENCESLEVGCEKIDSRTEEEKEEIKCCVEESTVVVSGGNRPSVKDEQVISQDEIGVMEISENEVLMKIESSFESEMKQPFHAFVNDEAMQQGDLYFNRKPVEETNENKTTTPKIAHSDAEKNVNENEETSIDSNRGDSDKSILEGANVNPLVSPRKNGAKGKVSEFVQFFDQDPYSRPSAYVKSRRSQSCRWKATVIDQNENEVDENLKKNEATTNKKTMYLSESLRWDSRISVENWDDPFEDDFMVQELTDDHKKVTEIGEEFEDMKAIDAKIQQWSSGKKGNIRSLLSTLQYVLWPGSGWKAIPLVDLIESNSVKRAYQKALLRLHPDKLQQKNASSNYKYIAEKVFDILQEAWDYFTTLAPI